ncbi:hypothetical protein NX059_005202 [Plenodomus lindquistii]|nr:hypothetical protein NX059_005202 [Plenodomus lindquistii]
MNSGIPRWHDLPPEYMETDLYKPGGPGFDDQLDTLFDDRVIMAAPTTGIGQMPKRYGKNDGPLEQFIKWKDQYLALPVRSRYSPETRDKFYNRVGTLIGEVHRRQVKDDWEKKEWRKRAEENEALLLATTNDNKQLLARVAGLERQLSATNWVVNNLPLALEQERDRKQDREILDVCLALAKQSRTTADKLLAAIPICDGDEETVRYVRDTISSLKCTEENITDVIEYTKQEPSLLEVQGAITDRFKQETDYVRSQLAPHLKQAAESEGNYLHGQRKMREGIVLCRAREAKNDTPPHLYDAFAEVVADDINQRWQDKYVHDMMQAERRGRENALASVDRREDFLLGYLERERDGQDPKLALARELGSCLATRSIGVLYKDKINHKALDVIEASDEQLSEFEMAFASTFAVECDSGKPPVDESKFTPTFVPRPKPFKPDNIVGYGEIVVLRAADKKPGGLQIASNTKAGTVKPSARGSAAADAFWASAYTPAPDVPQTDPTQATPSAPSTQPAEPNPAPTTNTNSRPVLPRILRPAVPVRLFKNEQFMPPTDEEYHGSQGFTSAISRGGKPK